MGIIDWHGDDVIANVQETAQEAIDETTAAVAEDAQGTVMNLPPHSAAGHPWYDITTRTEEAVASEPAEVEGTKVTGRVGATERRGGYAFFLERLHPYIRPPADREFPQLAKRIREKL